MGSPEPVQRPGSVLMGIPENSAYRGRSQSHHHLVAVFQCCAPFIIIKCVTMSHTATNALVEMGIRSYLIIQHVKLTKKESFYLVLLTQKHKT